MASPKVPLILLHIFVQWVGHVWETEFTSLSGLRINGMSTNCWLDGAVLAVI